MLARLLDYLYYNNPRILPKASLLYKKSNFNRRAVLLKVNNKSK